MDFFMQRLNFKESLNDSICLTLIRLFYGIKPMGDSSLLNLF